MIASARHVIEASSVGDAALAIIQSSRSGRVDGVYRRAINVDLSAGLVSLVKEPSERGPLNITLNPPVGILSLGVEPGDLVEVEGTNLCVVGKLTVSLISASYFKSELRLAHAVGEAALRKNLEVLKKTGLADGNLSGIGGLLPFEPGRMAAADAAALNVFSRAAARLIDRLAAAFLRGDSSIDRAVSDLVGLGPGLTPASDDFLAGMAIFLSLYSARSSSLRRASHALTRAIAAESAGATTRLSEAYLKQAAEGRGNETVTALCRAVLSEGPASVVGEAQRLIAIGETSGTDTLFGVVVAGALCLRHKDFRGVGAW